MTFTTIFQASTLYKCFKWKHCAAYGNYSGPARLRCDYNVISVQLQLQLPTGTELGKKYQVPRIIYQESDIKVSYISDIKHKSTPARSYKVGYILIGCFVWNPIVGKLDF